MQVQRHSLPSLTQSPPNVTRSKQLSIKLFRLNPHSKSRFPNSSKLMFKSPTGVRNHGGLVAVRCEAAPQENRDDGFYMRRCVELAKKAIGRTSHNPMVGCVIVKDSKIVGEGFHPKAGQPYAEVLTALAFTLFAKERVDIAVIEAGLGGARDATNVIPSSGLAISIITTIGEEHLAALGGSLESIAMAKSGIMKHGCPVRWF